MALTKRHLTFLAWLPALVLALAAPVTRLHAAPPVEAPVTFRTLALGAPVSDLFYDHRGKPVRVTAGSSGFSGTYFAPEDGHVKLYRLLPPEAPETIPRRVAVTDLHLGEGGPFLVFLMTDPAAPTVTRGLVVDDSWEKHPTGTMHLFSFSLRPVAVKVGEQTVQLMPGRSHAFVYPDEKRVWLQAATREGDRWVTRVGAPQVTFANARSTVVLLDQEPSIERPTPDGLQVRNFIDFAPPPVSP